MDNTELRVEKIGIAPDELSEFLHNKADPLLVFDLRSGEDFAAGHIDGSAHVVFDTRTKEAIMPKIPKTTKIILVCEDGTISYQTAKMMKSYGLNAYSLQGGIKNWNKGLVSKNADTLVSAEKLWQYLKQKDEDIMLLVDVREPNEFSDFRIPGSINIPLSNLFKPDVAAKLPRKKEIVTICSKGNRSMVGVFALATNGVEAKSLFGGLAAWGQVLASSEIASDNPEIIQVRKVGKGCLSYIVASQSEALVVDPIYPFDKYIELAKERGLKITKVVDTHQHADHISSASNLARISGAEFFMSSYEKYDFESTHRLKDGDIIKIGGSKIRAIHTPGHTVGGLSYLLDGRYLFTGDVLLIDGIGRPDLRDKAKEFAGELYNTLHEILKLPDNVIVLPAHYGELVDATKGVYTTIGQTKGSPFLNLKKEEFINRVVRTVFPRPMNYNRIIRINSSEASINENEIPDLEIGPNKCAVDSAI